MYDRSLTVGAVAALLVTTLLGTTGVARGEPVRLQVRGETHTQLRWSRPDPSDDLELQPPGDPSLGSLMLEGQALDDAERPLPHARVQLRWSHADPSAPPALSQATVVSTTCSRRGPMQPSAVKTQEASVQADEDGRFCVRLRLPLARYELEVLSRPDPGSQKAAWYDSTPLRMAIDFDRQPTMLWLEGNREELNLDHPLAALQARIGSESEGRLSHHAGLSVEWQDEHGQSLARAQSDAQGRLLFSVPTEALGEPGNARHRLLFAGTPQLGRAELAFAVEKRVTLQLSPLELPTEVTARARTRFSARVTVPHRNAEARPVPAAQVQVRLDGELLGIAETDHDGVARLEVVLPEGGRSAMLELSAQSPDTALLPSQIVQHALEIEEPRSFRSLWISLGFAVLLGWLALGRSPRWAISKRNKASATGAPEPAVPQAIVQNTDESAIPRWHGQVLDAHDRTPIAHAHVQLWRPSFAGRERLADTHCDAEGRFELEGQARKPGDRLSVESPLYRPLEVSPPAFGRLQISAVSRRRALLQDFSRWVAQRPWAQSLRKKPTPLEVAKVHEEYAEWAQQLDAAAFGAEGVDESKETHLRMPSE